MPNQRIIFSKLDTARFISHLDLMRTFQRAFLRAGIPIRHTEGFNPHPFVSILLPLSVGFGSQCEILEFGLPDGISKEEVPARLNAVLPAGITVRRCYDAVLPARNLAFVNYVVTFEYVNGLPEGAEAALCSLLESESLIVSKRSKKARSGETQVDLIPLIKSFITEGNHDSMTLCAVLRAQNPGLNPELIISAFVSRYPNFTPDLASYHRRAVLDEGLSNFE